MSDTPDHSPSGVPIYRYKPRERAFEFAVGDSDAIKAVDQHIAAHVGTPATVLHEIVSDLVHIDIHIVAPSRQRNYYTLVTSGMSDRLMNTPEAAKGMEYAELMLCLPPDWPMLHEYEIMTDQPAYWPLRCLKWLARFPHEFQTWLWASHTVPNGNPPQPYALNTKLCCAFLASPVLFDDAFRQLPFSQEKTVHFLSLLPLYKEEMNLKLREGTDPLLDRLARHGVTELLDIQRPNTCKKRFRLF